MNDIYLDEQGFIWVDDFRLPFRLVGGELEFLDKDRRRCSERGERFVRVEAQELIEVLKENKS
jgi:hypothetical protein